MSLLGRIALASAHFETAEALLAESQRGLERKLGRRHASTIEAKRWLAGCQYQNGEAQKALQTVEVAIVSASAIPKGHWRLAALHGLKGRCLDAIGRRDEAQPELEAAIASLRATLGPLHPETLRVANALRRVP